MQSIAPRLRALRESIGFSQEKLAAALGYIFARTDNPQGKSYDFHPQHDPQHEELRRFLDMCFEPGTPANAKLKDSLYRMMEEQK